MNRKERRRDKKLVDKQGRLTFGIVPKSRGLFPYRGWYLYTNGINTLTGKWTTTIEGIYIDRQAALGPYQNARLYFVSHTARHHWRKPEGAKILSPSDYD